GHRVKRSELTAFFGGESAASDGVTTASGPAHHMRRQLSASWSVRAAADAGPPAPSAHRRMVLLE
ncbi:hypothetical protein CYMTET_36752, partial [Cymbomonas tetramitiformis]